jgi:uncharacterized glyoxalase superfamily protein PhnB
MIGANKRLGSAVVPVMRYRNLPAAIDWLCGAFGFEKQRITVDSSGALLFAQLAFGNCLIMVSPVRSSSFDKLMRQPDEIGGAETQVCYFFVPDAHAHCARARAAGAAIVFDVEDRAHGGRSYSCRDPEGHLWNFGTYDPWQHGEIGDVSPRFPSGRTRNLATRSVLAVGLLAGVAALVVSIDRAPYSDSVRMKVAPIETGSIIRGERDSDKPLEPFARDETASVAAESTSMAAQQRLARALLEADLQRRIADEAREQHSRATREKEAAEQVVKELQQRLTKAWSDKNAAELSVKDARRQLARERAARRFAPQARTEAQPRAPLW